MFKKRWGGHKKARPRKEQAQRRKAKDGTRQLDPQQWQVQQNIGETTRQCMFCAINRQNFAADAPQTKRDGTGRRHLPTALGHNRTEQKKGRGQKSRSRRRPKPVDAARHSCHVISPRPWARSQSLQRRKWPAVKKPPRAALRGDGCAPWR